MDPALYFLIKPIEKYILCFSIKTEVWIHFSVVKKKKKQMDF